MISFANRNVGWKIAFAFCFVIALGLGGYWNADRVINASLAHNRQTQAIISASITHAQEATLNAHDTAANTVAYVYSGSDSDRDHKWETNDAARQAFQDLRQSLTELPNNGALVALADTADQQEENVCNPQEDHAIKLKNDGQSLAAQALVNGPYIGMRYRLELDVASLVAKLRDYQLVSETSETTAMHQAINVGWLMQIVILFVSGAIAVAVSRHTSSTLTQLQQAQTKMQQSEQLLLAAQRIAQIGNWQMNVTSKIADWSNEMYRILGLAPGQTPASQESYVARIHPDDANKVQEHVLRAQTDRLPFELYHRLLQPDGTLRWVHARGEFQEGLGGTIMTGTLQDVTTRIQAEDALREGEARFQRIVANMPGMVYRFVIHSDGVISWPFASQGSRDIYNLEPEQIQAEPSLIVNMVHPDDALAFHTSVGTSAQTLTPWQWEGRVILPSGEQKWLRGISRPERLDNGDVLWDGILMDITERRRTEEALSQSEERFRSLIRNASDTILILDAASRLRYFSPGIQQQGGHDPATLDGKCFLDFVHPDDLTRARSVLAQTIDSPGVNLTTELRLLNGDGTYHPVEVITNNLFHEPSISGIVATCRDVTERKAFEQELAHHAFHDTLTGLPNRSLFLDRLEHALARAKRQDTLLAVLFLDLDNFKIINDSLGHQTGDQFLVAVADRFSACLRPGDTVARIGGDEFCLLLEDLANEKEALQITERLVTELRASIPLPGRDVQTTASIGIAISDGTIDISHGLLRDADTAMYQAKNNGKARYEVFTRSMNDQAMERLELESDLRRAIDDGELRLHYQPIVLLKTGQTREVEALVRWQHPKRGLIPPGKFIPIAEETGLIIPLGYWVLREACQQARTWQQNQSWEPSLVVSVNLSGRQLQETDCVARIKQIFTETGVRPETLKLEITETVMMKDADATAEKLAQIKALGVHLAVDDFGTGYSSMAVLSRFPIDTLKIDRTFIQKLDDPEGLAIVHAIVTLAHSLKLNVTCEGVETRAQWEQLRALGCEWGQGFHFARPLTVEALTPLLAGTQQMYSQLTTALPAELAA